MYINPILRTDSYKLSHNRQYAPNTEKIFSYIESRGGPGSHPGTIVCGLQMFLEDYLTHIFTKEEVEEAKAFADQHILGPSVFPYDGWMTIVNECGGNLPLQIDAVAEGSYVPSHNILLSITNTNPKVPWLVSWFETSLLRALWYPTNVATISNSIKKVIYSALLKTSDDPDGQINFKLHDFGARGVSSGESAALGGVGHLFNFMGSDTIESVLYANHYYNDGNMSAFSIPAAEHSTITAWGKKNEYLAFKNMLDQFKGSPIIAVVSDSYDLDNAVNHIWGELLKEDVIKSGSTIVIRPDSGSPIEDIVLRTVKNLDDKFGSTVNSKGYKVLNNVRVIQGDGINEGTIRFILFKIIQAGYSADNVSFGMGGALLQQHNRDTFKFAMKAYMAFINRDVYRVYKDPITDPGKRSKSGILDLIQVDGKYKTIDRMVDKEYKKYPSQLINVFANGEITKKYTLTDIRARIDERIHEVAREEALV